MDAALPTLKLRFRWISEETPDERWGALFERAWPMYRPWFLSEGDGARPDLDASRAALARHMPELVQVWERLTDLAGGDEQAARMLSLYRPTPYLSGCTQAIWRRGGRGRAQGPVLVRNYDYHPHACEATFLRTRWLGTTVLASSDCLWGALDGINEHGLAVALSFGGSRVVGDGFGIPLILRYVLETCAGVAEAREALRRVPSHMAYNVSLADDRGDYLVAYLRPGAEAEFVREAVAANHQRRIDWPEYAARTSTTERHRAASSGLRDAESPEALVRRFLEPPLFVTNYHGWHGTLYTAAYDTQERAMEVRWRGAGTRQAVDDFREVEFDVPFPGETEAGGRRGPAG